MRRLGLAVLLALLASPASAQVVPNAGGGSGSAPIGTSGTAGTLCAVVASATPNLATTSTSEQTLATVTLPANALATDGSFAEVEALYTTAANGNNKTETMAFNGTTVAVRTANGDNTGIIFLKAAVLRASATTQIGMGYTLHTNSGGSAVSGVTSSAPAATLSGTVDITLKATTPTATGDSTLKSYTVKVCNR